LIQEEKDSAEQRAEELENQVGGVSMGGVPVGGVPVGGPSAGGPEAVVSRWHTHQSFGGQMSSPGTDLPAVPSPAMHPRSAAISQHKYLVVSTVAGCCLPCDSACCEVHYDDGLSVNAIHCMMPLVCIVKY